MSEAAQVKENPELQPQILNSGFPADGSAEEARAFVKNYPPTGDDANEWTEDQRRAFNVLAHEFGVQHREHHANWHRENGPGGTNGAGSGMKFLAFHREMLREFKEWSGMEAPRGWDPSTPLPAEFTDPTRIRNNPGIERPGWLTLDGNGTKNENQDIKPIATLDGKQFLSLNDFNNPDELGRALGESGYHAAGHIRIGGNMVNFETSPLDPAFLAWHGHIDKLIDQWLATPKGQVWAKMNPDNPLIKVPGPGPKQQNHHMTESPPPAK